MIRIHSLTARLATLFAVLAASLLVLAAMLFGRMLDMHFQELDMHELQGKVTLIRNALQSVDATGGRSERIEALERSFVGHESVGVLVRDVEGRVLYIIHPEHFTASQRAGEPLSRALTDWTVDERPHRGLEVSIALPSLGAKEQTIEALVAVDLSHHVHFLASVRHATWAGVFVAALAAALFGWFAAHRGLAPLRRVTETARRLSARQLGQRLAIDDAPLEVRDHVEAFNGMLARLEAAFQRLGDYSADIAHELRTPISNLMTQTQVALSRPRTLDEYQDILASNLEEYERIARMVSDMLFLAKADENTLAHAGEAIDLAREADALIDFYEALADERQVRIVRQGQASVQGDRLMLRRALSNLISNALRHTPKEGQITIRIDADAAGVRLAVSNVGDPIPADQIERIFERFHRGSAQRESRGEGAGLGLAITRSIVQAHGGHITARSAEGVTCFTITLPRNEASSPS
ncbi:MULTISPECIES: heavy metal sensor histidine kinase [Thauera]|jgi:two-component system heavy metal sensor histidine kinase CusS|uniref:Sensor protein n=3 Tax=Thauera TaxID=33057 RepID=N6Z2W8_9RHOO|nr:MULTISPECIES: heavy metal sensor histidine kinase [Thauera]ACR02569.1 heavy metal sensor signal transduction histidine kinase [Thauera aminoaromatica]APR05918.1 Heavy metal sensor histidine kinase [Thauera chlorobenzoica]ENO98240.1 heavy metal sensor signal transduction histidine kinase [Thauera phenylacetica B4P]